MRSFRAPALLALFLPELCDDGASTRAQRYCDRMPSSRPTAT